MTTSKNCYRCDEVIVLDEVEGKDVRSPNYIDIEYRYNNTNNPICETCYDGSACFTCEFCQDGLATEVVDYDKRHDNYGQREHWCASCVIDNDSDDLEYAGMGRWVISA